MIYQTLFNLYVDNLERSGDGLHHRCFIGYVVCTDDLLLLSPSVIGSHGMLAAWYCLSHSV
jgi:hypothetical protein